MPTEHPALSVEAREPEQQYIEAARGYLVTHGIPTSGKLRDLAWLIQDMASAQRQAGAAEEREAILDIMERNKQREVVMHAIRRRGELARADSEPSTAGSSEHLDGCKWRQEEIGFCECGAIARAPAAKGEEKS